MRTLLRPSEEGQKPKLWEQSTDVLRMARRAVAAPTTIIDHGVPVNIQYVNMTPWKDPFVKRKLAIGMHDTATTDVSMLALTARHTRRDSRQASWGHGVGDKGEVVRAVDEKVYNAWHAGEVRIPRTSPYRDYTSGQFRQICCGVENLNPNRIAGSATDAQREMLPQVVAMLMAIHEIDEVQPGVNFFMHRDLAGFRGKTDAVSYLLEYVAQRANQIHRGRTSPRIGTFYISTDNHMAAMIRPTFTKKQAPIGRKLWGEPVNVDAWELNGEEAIDGSGRKDWAHVTATRTSPAGWIYGMLLSDQPPRTTLLSLAVPAVTSTAHLLWDQAQVKYMKRTLSMIECGGLVFDQEEAAQFAYLSAMHGGYNG